MASDRSRRAHQRRVHRRPASPWPAVIALLTVGIVYGLLPDRLRAGPRWLLPALLTVLVAAALGARWRGYLSIAFWLARGLQLLITLALAGSVVLLVTTLPGSCVSGDRLFVEAALLWGSNVVVFAL